MAKHNISNNETTPAECRTLAEELVESVRAYADQITVEVAGAPPFIVAVDEFGLTHRYKPVVFEARRSRSAISHWRLT